MSKKTIGWIIIIAAIAVGLLITASGAIFGEQTFGETGLLTALGTSGVIVVGYAIATSVSSKDEQK